MNNMPSLIEIKNVTFEYDSEDFEHAALKNINLNIEKGSFNVILGHNGSGKSTLAKLLNGLIKPTNGKVFVDGIDTSDESKEFEVRKKLGMVFQNPDNQIICTVVEEEVAFGPENLGVPSEEIRKRVDNALKLVNMSEFKKSAPHRLSGGQKQRVALAGILAMEPECIVLDESTAMLDPIGRKEVINAVHDLNKNKGITIILITHFMEEAFNSDRVIVMNDGSIVDDDTPENIFSKKQMLENCGLDLPQTTNLLHMLSDNGYKVNTGKYSVSQTALEIAGLFRRVKNIGSD